MMPETSPPPDASQDDEMLLDAFVRTHLSDILASAAQQQRARKTRPLAPSSRRDRQAEGEGEGEGDEATPSAPALDPIDPIAAHTTHSLTTTTAARLLRARAKGLELQLAAAERERDARGAELRALRQDLAGARLAAEASAREARTAEARAEARAADERHRDDVRAWARERAVAQRAASKQARLVEVLRAQREKLLEQLGEREAEEGLVRAMMMRVGDRDEEEDVGRRRQQPGGDDVAGGGDG